MVKSNCFSKPNGDEKHFFKFIVKLTSKAKDIYPFQRLDDLVEKAAAQDFYALLDLKDAYFQIELDITFRDLTLSDGYSLFRLRRLPF